MFPERALLVEMQVAPNRQHFRQREKMKWSSSAAFRKKSKHGEKESDSRSRPLSAPRIALLITAALEDPLYDIDSREEEIETERAVSRAQNKTSSPIENQPSFSLLPLFLLHPLSHDLARRARRRSPCAGACRARGEKMRTKRKRREEEREKLDRACDWAFTEKPKKTLDLNLKLSIFTQGFSPSVLQEYVDALACRREAATARAYSALASAAAAGAPREGGEGDDDASRRRHSPLKNNADDRAGEGEHQGGDARNNEDAATLASLGNLLIDKPEEEEEEEDDEEEEGNKSSNNNKNDDDARLAALAREAAELSSRAAAARAAAAAARQEAVADAAADRVAAATDSGDLEGAAAALLRYERRVLGAAATSGSGTESRGESSCRTPSTTAETLRGSLEQAIDSALLQGLGLRSHTSSAAAAVASSPSSFLREGCDGGIPAVASGVRSALSASAVLSSSSSFSSSSSSDAVTRERARAIGSSVLAETLLLPLLRLGLEEKVEIVEASDENGFWWRKREASAAAASLLLPEDAAAEAVRFFAAAVLPRAGQGGSGSGNEEVRSRIASLVGAAAWPRASAAEVELRLSPAAADRAPGGARAREAFAEIGSAALRLEAAAEAAGFAPPSSPPSNPPSRSPSSNVTAAGGGRLAAFVAAVADRDLVGLRLEVVEAARALLVRGSRSGSGGGGGGREGAGAPPPALPLSPPRRRVGAPLPRRSPDADAWFALAAAARDRSGNGDGEGGGRAADAASPSSPPPLLDWGPEGSDAPLLAEGEFAVSECGDALAALVADAVARASILARGGSSGTRGGGGSGTRKNPAAAQALARGAADAAELAALLPPALSPQRSLLLLLGPAALHRNDCRHVAGAITRSLAAHAPALREGSPAAPGLLADAAHRLRASGDAALAERVAAEAEALTLLFDGPEGGGGALPPLASTSRAQQSPEKGSKRRMLASLAGRAAAAAVAAAAGRNSQRSDGSASASASAALLNPPSSIHAASNTLPGGVFARLSADRDPARAAAAAARAVTSCLSGLSRAGRAVRGTLPPRERAAVAASLLDSCCSAAANRVLQREDIPAADSEAIPALLTPLVEAGAAASLGLDFSRFLGTENGGSGGSSSMLSPLPPWPPRGRRHRKRQQPEGGEGGDEVDGEIETEIETEDEDDRRVSAAVDASSPPEAELLEAVEASAPALAALKVSFYSFFLWPFLWSSARASVFSLTTKTEKKKKKR